MKQNRFVVISDTHFFAPQPGLEDKFYWNRVLQTRSSEIGLSLVETINELAPAFVIHCGDITGHCDLENWSFATQLLDELNCPWYAVLGNHDTWFPGVRKAFSKRYGLPGGQGHYRRDLAGIRFLFLDLAHWYDDQGGVSPYLDKELADAGKILGMGPSQEELLWLESELANSAEQFVVLVSHSPLSFKKEYQVATLPKGKLAPSSPIALNEFILGTKQRKVIKEMISIYSNVKVAFAGHWHINDVIAQNGVVFCQTASLREFPFEIRVVDVESKRLIIETVSLKNSAFRELSFIPEWKNDWISGTPSERNYTVELD